VLQDHARQPCLQLTPLLSLSGPKLRARSAATEEKNQCDEQFEQGMLENKEMGNRTPAETLKELERNEDELLQVT
jgi:hypothetical protein